MTRKNVQESFKNHVFLDIEQLRNCSKCKGVLKDLGISLLEFNKICRDFLLRKNREDKFRQEQIGLVKKEVEKVVSKVEKHGLTIDEDLIALKVCGAHAAEYRFDFIWKYVIDWFDKRIHQEIDTHKWIETEKGHEMDYNEAKKDWKTNGYNVKFRNFWAKILTHRPNLKKLVD